ncbi:DUF6882 domain-containing protein [Streptomyces sp. A1136]|uniref:DUF6882 domain-containing protein n=1 Tax=Streptomyces sp. A1136 TaxID=2563102 RepID=UPI00109E546B|nr:DUF6882 domain-containing protein [Streptomyces sp. A1136]THA53179.1 hypothetical protein E6R62_18965 [Streptomyces sp. A1136]
MTTAFSDAFLHAAEYHAAWGVQQLEMIDRAFPSGPWTADLDQCRYESGGRSLRVGLLGSYDLAEQTWLWGWANPGLRGSKVAAASARIPEFGRRHGIVELQQEGVALARFADPRRAAEALAFLGMAVLGAPGYIGQEAGPQTRVYFVPQDPQLQPARLDPVAMPRHLLTGAQLFARSPRLVVNGWFALHGVPVQEAADQITASLPSGGAAVVSFDSAGRISGVNAGPVSA